MHASGSSRSAMARGRTIFGRDTVETLHRYILRAAFSVASSLRICRAGFRSAAVTAVPAINDDGPRPYRQAVAPGPLEPLAPFGLLARGAWFGAERGLPWGVVISWSLGCAGPLKLWRVYRAITDPVRPDSLH